MSFHSVARNLTVLGLNAAEALIFAVFDFDRQADALWGTGLREFAEDKRCSTDWLVEKEAEEEVTEPDCLYYECARPECKCHENSSCRHFLGPTTENFVYNQTSSVADPSPEAADDHRGGSIPNHDVEPPRLPTLHPACLFVAEAAVREMAKAPGAMGYGSHFLREVADELHTIYEAVK